jgi:hypothetical protein
MLSLGGSRQRMTHRSKQNVEFNGNDRKGTGNHPRACGAGFVFPSAFHLAERDPLYERRLVIGKICW